MKTVRQQHSAFSLIEMLVVIAIIGILAAISLPGLKNFQKGDVMAAATRQIESDVARARQLAISQRTTVYMIFCPSNFWINSSVEFNALPQVEKDKAANLYDRQLESYTFVTLRSVGEQPGQLSPRYLSPWRAMPEGAYIPMYKFAARTAPPTPVYDPPQITAATPRFQIRGFTTTDTLPFPSAEAYNPAKVNQKFVSLPYIAFNHLGQLTSGEDEYIPLALGRINQARDAVGNPLPPRIIESPIGNASNAFHVIHIDWLTGRGRLEKQEVQ